MKEMTNRERIKAILNYNDYDRLPIVSFGFWPETIQKWRDEGHITIEETENWEDGYRSSREDGTPADRAIGQKLGFDFNWLSTYSPISSFSIVSLYPAFERKILEELPDGSQKVLDTNGVVVIEIPGVVSLPHEVDRLLKDRKSWEEHYLPRLQFSENRITESFVTTDVGALPLENGGLERLRSENRDEPIGLSMGSLFGEMRNWLGVEGVSYLYMDNEALFDEIIQTVAELCYKCIEKILSLGAKFDFGNFWEDICCKSGPLVTPSVFSEKNGPCYKRITDLANGYGIDIISVDCDGVIDSLIPTWIANGVNTMTPIEVGTWDANIKPWREKYGKQIRGVGGMKKGVFSQDYAAIDAEVERLKPLIELGGYIPCPDHRIAPDAKWENVQYYCEKMRIIFSR